MFRKSVTKRGIVPPFRRGRIRTSHRRYPPGSRGRRTCRRGTLSPGVPGSCKRNSSRFTTTIAPCRLAICASHGRRCWGSGSCFSLSAACGRTCAVGRRTPPGRSPLETRQSRYAEPAELAGADLPRAFERRLAGGCLGRDRCPAPFSRESRGRAGPRSKGMFTNELYYPRI